MEAQTIIFAFVADDLSLVFTFTTNGDISADTFEFVVVKKNGAFVFRKTSGAGITITTPGTVSTPGVVTVDIADQLEIAVGTYDWRLRRTNVGREKVVAWGDMPLPPSFKGAA